MILLSKLTDWRGFTLAQVNIKSVSVVAFRLRCFTELVEASTSIGQSLCVVTGDWDPGLHITLAGVLVLHVALVAWLALGGYVLFKLFSKVFCLFGFAFELAAK
jgi:hypothetical protein